MDDCIFCRMAAGTAPAYIVYEDEYAMAVLDIYPIKRGQTVVFSKEHTSSNFTQAPIEIVQKTLEVAQNASTILEQKLSYDRTFVVIQGLGVNHLHIKLYPKYSNDRESFKIYMPEKASEQELKTVYIQIRGIL